MKYSFVLTLLILLSFTSACRKREERVLINSRTAWEMVRYVHIFYPNDSIDPRDAQMDYLILDFKSKNKVLVYGQFNAERDENQLDFLTMLLNRTDVKQGNPFEFEMDYTVNEDNLVIGGHSFNILHMENKTFDLFEWLQHESVGSPEYTSYSASYGFEKIKNKDIPN